MGEKGNRPLPAQGDHKGCGLFFLALLASDQGKERQHDSPSRCDDETSSTGGTEKPSRRSRNRPIMQPRPHRAGFSFPTSGRGPAAPS